MGYCIVHNPLLLQPLRHWFTFISRKYEHLAVEDFVVKDLPDSRGSCLRLLPCFPLCAFIIAHSWLFVKHFFCQVLYYYREDTWREPRGFCLLEIFLPPYHHYTTGVLVCQGVFYIFFRAFEGESVAPTARFTSEVLGLISVVHPVLLSP